MPATRRNRTSGGPAAKGSQSTLSFSGNRSRIIKPSVPISSKGGKGLVEDVKTETPKTEDLTIAEPAEAVEQVKVELSKPKSEAERLAEKVTDAQIKTYWRGREAERTVERVHQEGLSVEEKVLRYFDVSSQYGPCIGIARMKRWVRANKLGLNPPIEVLAILLKEERGGNTGVERAHIDELMSNFIGGGE